MKRTNLKRALLASAALLLVATGAYGQSTNANPQAKGNPAAKADEKGKDKGEAKGEAKGETKGKDVADRAARKARQLEEQKGKLKSLLKAPMDEATKQELRHHAERVARLERIKSLADTAKDTEVVEKATKLLAKESARHDKWMEKHVEGGAK